MIPGDKRDRRIFRDSNRRVTDDMREATHGEVIWWLYSDRTDPRFHETEFGLMVRDT